MECPTQKYIYIYLMSNIYIYIFFLLLPLLLLLLFPFLFSPPPPLLLFLLLILLLLLLQVRVQGLLFPSLVSLTPHSVVFFHFSGYSFLVSFPFSPYSGPVIKYWTSPKPFSFLTLHPLFRESHLCLQL